MIIHEQRVGKTMGWNRERHQERLYELERERERDEVEEKKWFNDVSTLETHRVHQPQHISVWLCRISQSLDVWWISKIEIMRNVRVKSVQYVAYV